MVLKGGYGGAYMLWEDEGVTFYVPVYHGDASALASSIRSKYVEAVFFNYVDNIT